MFESSVVSYGSQTEYVILTFKKEFESSVVSYGSQTKLFTDTMPL